MQTEAHINHELVSKAIKYALIAHNSTNQKYDGQSYVVHLEHVRKVSKNYMHLVPEHAHDNIICALWCHDVMEDCRQTYNDIKKELSEKVAELVRAVTSDIRGRTRDERMHDGIYADIRNTPYATFIKLCDRIANVEYSKSKGSSMFNKYKKEHFHFVQQLWDEQYKQMFDYLEKLFNE